MSKLTYNPAYKAVDQDCGVCDIPNRSRESALKFGCEYVENMLAAEKAPKFGPAPVEGAADEVAPLEISGSPFSEPGSAERAALKAKVDGPWGAGAASIEAADLEASSPKPASDNALGSYFEIPLDSGEIKFHAVNPGDIRSLLATIREEITPKESAGRASSPSPIIDELLALVAAPNPEEHMRGRLIQSLRDIRMLMDRSVMMAKSFSWEHVDVELVNVRDFLDRAISAAEQVKPKEEHNKS